MKLNNKLKIGAKIGASVLIGGLSIYASEKTGLSDFMINYEIWKASYFGEWAKNLAEYCSPAIRIGSDIGTGSFSGFLTYVGLEKLSE